MLKFFVQLFAETLNSDLLRRIGIMEVAIMMGFGLKPSLFFLTKSPYHLTFRFVQSRIDPMDEVFTGHSAS
jgi:hypothetical protein